MLSLRDVTVLWLHEGLEPSSGAFDGRWPYSNSSSRHPFHHDIHGALQHVKDNMAAHKRERLMPWLHVGTGQGAAVLNEQGILAIGLAIGVFP